MGRTQEPDTVKALRLYKSQGLNALPLCPPKRHARMPHWHSCSSPGKVPVGRWAECHSEKLSEAKLESWVAHCLHAGHPPNVGLVLGETSGLVSLDADGSEAVEWCELELGPMLDTARFTTGRGVRWVYSCAGPWPRSRTIRPGVEVLSRGRQTVAPPSLHPNGKRYAWVGCDRRTWQRHVRPWPFVIEAGPIGPASINAGERTLAVGERNTALFRMACALRRHGVGAEAMRGCLGVLNGMCLIPLGEDELDSIARSTMKYTPAAMAAGVYAEGRAA